MRSIIWLMVAAFPAFAGDWNRVFEEGWTPPQSYFMYGYSEFTPPFLAGVRPYELRLLDHPKRELMGSRAFREFVGMRGRKHSFLLSHYEELRHVQPGFGYLAKHWLGDLKQLVAGDAPGGATLKGIPEFVVRDNEYWTEEISRHASTRVVTLAPLVMSRTQEDLGRTHPWTVYGGAELSWEEIFWKHSQPANPVAWWCGLLEKVFSETTPCNLTSRGLFIFTKRPALVPTSLRPFVETGSGERRPKYLVTFEPLSSWPAAWRALYAQRKLEVIPHPSSLIFSRSPLFEELSKKSPEQEAKQLPLAIEFSQFARGLGAHSFYGLKAFDLGRRRRRFQAEPAEWAPAPIGNGENPFIKIFEPNPKAMGLYDKPLARNTQAWTVLGSAPNQVEWFMHGPSATRSEIDRVRARLQSLEGPSHVHYRNYFPPMDINGYTARWYRPLVAWTKPGSNDVEVDTELLGSVRLTKGSREEWFPIEMSDEGAEVELAGLKDRQGNPETTALNVRKLTEFSALLDEKLSPDVASALLNPLKNPEMTFQDWRLGLSQNIRAVVDASVDSQKAAPVTVPLTYASTVNDEFELRYWKKVVELTEGPERLHKNNTDCASTDQDPRGRDEHCSRNHLPDVLVYLRHYYERELKLSKVHLHSFDWKTDFDFEWDGLKQTQHNLIVVIHGKDGKRHDEAIIMADHYDTAHMGDIYEGENYAEKKKETALIGHRHASKGADDNHSATAALMEAARVLKDMPLKKDVWLVHITGEEFPADGLGSRALCQALIENQALIPGEKNPRIAGVYILDMVGHSTDRDSAAQEPSRAVFQIAPGRGERAAKLALHAHQATSMWNATRTRESWDAKFRRTKYWTRFQTPKNTPVERFPLPQLGKFLPLVGELRPGWHFRSSLFNTDIQLFSDAGFPAVLFMENYDIARQGYHDTLDNLDMIDLDYARGVVSVAIETVAQAASR